MTTLGSLSIEKKSIRWSRADTDAYLIAAGVGVLAGIAVTYLRTPLHLPGHKVLLWMVPALACRMNTRARAGATASVLGTIGATLVLGGQLGGGALMMPLVLLAGVTLDFAVRAVERLRLSMGRALFLLALSGMAGNLICFIKRLFEPAGQLFSSGNVRDMLYAGVSHAVFGLIAGVVGAIVGMWIVKYQSRGTPRAAAEH